MLLQLYAETFFKYLESLRWNNSVFDILKFVFVYEKLLMACVENICFLGLENEHPWKSAM